MCFSAGASFAASASLTVIGVATIIKTRKTKDLPLAFIPLIFAIQQAIEGFLWLSLGRGGDGATLPLTYAFLFFAFLWWPIYSPLAAFFVEPHRSRQRIILFFVLLGTLVGFTLYAGFITHPIPAQIASRCIRYPIEIPYGTFLTYLYVLAAIGSGLFSSRPIIKLFSLLSGTFALISWLVYTMHFTSVWCFFAAVLSLFLFFSAKNKAIPRREKDTSLL